FVLVAAPVVVWLGRDKLIVVDPLTEGEAVTAMAMIGQQAGYPLRAVDVTINHREIRAEIQNHDQPEVTDRWTWSHWRGLRGLIDWRRVGGPNPADSARDTPVAQRVLDLQDVDLAAVPSIAAAALTRVALEDQASVREMSLTRPRI